MFKSAGDVHRKGICNFVFLKYSLIEKSAVGLIYFRLVLPNPFLSDAEKMCKSDFFSN